MLMNRRFCFLYAIALTYVASQCGCRSVADFRAGEIPVELNEIARGQGREIDLSQIARKAIDANRIYAGDVLGVTVSSGADSEALTPVAIRVNEDGTIAVPLVGVIQVGGMSR